LFESILMNQLCPSALALPVAELPKKNKALEEVLERAAMAVVALVQ
jgi:hypothetical protein